MNDELTLSVWDGRPAVDVTNKAGEVQRYWFEFTNGSHGEWKCVLWQPDKSYTVKCAGHGNPSCGCPSFTYNARRWEPVEQGGACKHIRTVLRLRVLVGALNGIHA